MTYDPKRTDGFEAHPNRRSIRLKGYDYAQSGAYFVTICTQNRAFLFGDVVEGVMRLNDAGRMIASVWDAIPTFYSGVDVDEFVVMPNHIHGIIVLGTALEGRHDSRQTIGFHELAQGHNGLTQGPAPTLSLADVVHRFKTLTTKRYADGVKQSGWPPFLGRVWQRNYYEHIIRDEEALNRIRQYIVENPLRWLFDRENPAATAPDLEEVWP